MAKVSVSQALDILSESRTTTIPELAEALMEEFKGPRGLAKAVKTVFDDESTTGQVQARLLADVMSIIKSANEMEPPETDKDRLSAQSDEELKQDIQGLLGKALDGQEG